jgi:DNA-binding response OmpR family regulator
MSDNRPVTVLLVEDSRVQRELIRAALIRLGYRVTSAATGQEAVGLYRAGEYDTLLVDVVLPDMPGIEILSHARKVDADQCVIMMTAEGSGLSAVEAVHAGADDYVTKPIRLDDEGAELKVIISRSLERRRLARENRELQARLVEASRVSAVISLAGAATHEMNQPLTVMAGITALLLMDADPEAPSYQDLETLHRATQRLCDIVGKLGAITDYRAKPYVGDVEIAGLERSAAPHAAS